MKTDNNRVIIIGLVLVIVVLLGIILTVFVIKPAINGYLTKSSQAPLMNFVSLLVDQASQCKQIPVSFNDKTVTLVSMECIQQQLQQASVK